MIQDRVRLVSRSHCQMLAVTGGQRPLMDTFQPVFREEVLWDEMPSNPIDATSFGPAGYCFSYENDEGKIYALSAVHYYSR